MSSNNTNKLSPQERIAEESGVQSSSNNTNKLSPQEHSTNNIVKSWVQIIQINLALKNVNVWSI